MHACHAACAVTFMGARFTRACALCEVCSGVQGVTRSPRDAYDVRSAIIGIGITFKVVKVRVL